MSIFSSIKSKFLRTKPQETIPDNLNPVHKDEIAKEVDSDDVEEIVILPQNGFNWIDNKDLLRDEGVYFGLSELTEKPEEKLNVIRSYFQEKIDKDSEAQKLLIEEKELLTAEVNSKKNEIENNRTLIRDLELNNKSKPHDFVRFSIGLLIYGLMLIFNYFLVYNWIRPYLRYPEVSAFGLYLFGSLSLFNKFSIIYNSVERVSSEEGHQNERWKIVLEEIFIPFIVSLYITYIGSGTNSTFVCLIFMLLIFTLFIYAGKGFLNTIFKVIKEYRIISENRNTLRINNIKISNMKSDIEKIQSWINVSEQKLVQIKKDIFEISQRIVQMKAEKETNVYLFLSEFELAKASKDELSPRQLTHLLSKK